MCVLLITRLLRGVGRWARKPVNHISWVAVVTPTDRPKSVCNCCLIELFCGVVCVATLPLWHFCWYRGFCRRTGSDLLPFVYIFIVFQRCIKIHINIDSLPVRPGAPPSLYPFFLQSCLHILSKVFRSTAKPHILEMGWIRCGSSKIQRSNWNILNLRISTI